MSKPQGGKGDGVGCQEDSRKQMWERRGLEVKDYRDGNAVREQFNTAAEDVKCKDVGGSRKGSRSYMDEWLIPVSVKGVGESTRWEPREGVVVYVNWETFSEALSEIWREYRATEWAVEGIYRKKIKQGWVVEFPALAQKSRCTYKLTDKWVQEHGRFMYTRRKILSKEIIMEGRKGPSLECADDLLFNGVNTDWEIPLMNDVENLESLLEDGVGGRGSMEHLCTGTWNVSGMDKGTLMAAKWLMMRRGIGLLCLQDTRLTHDSANYLRMVWSQIGGESAVMITVGEISGGHQSGGQAMLLLGPWTYRRRHHWEDPTGLGLVMELTFAHKDRIIRIISVYWPAATAQTATEGLQARTMRWLQLKGKDISTDAFVQSLIESRVNRLTMEVVVLGDLNQHWGIDLREWLNVLQLRNYHDSWMINTRFSGSDPTGTIDYVLGNVQQIEGHCEGACEWQQFSDHRPLWTRLILRLPDLLERPAPQQCRQTSRTAKGGAELAKFQWKALRGVTLMQQNGLEAGINHLVKSHRIPIRKCQKHMWSPETSALIFWQRSLRRLKKGGTGAQRMKILMDCEREIKEIGQEGAHLWAQMKDRVALVSAEKSETAEEAIGIALKQVHRELAGRKNKLRREAQKAAIAQRAKDPYRFFKVMGPQRRSQLLQTIKDGVNVYTDPGGIRETIRYHYEKHFKSRKELPDDLWSSWMDFEHFEKYTCGVIPQHLLKIVHRAIYAGKKRLDFGTLTWAKLTPTLEEFLKLIRKSPDRSAGGPSGCSYRILKDSPGEVLQEIYEQLLAGWKKGNMAKWQKRKLLYPIPKDKHGLTDVKRTRPIMLLEVTRKLWIKLVFKKIMEHWELENLLENNQLGFRKGRGILHGIVSLINVMELGIDGDRPILGSSWDITSAFDSVERPIIDLALRRLGVERSLATFLSKLDEEDEVRVVGIGHERSEAFTTHRGAGQGDSASPFIWIAFFDIILTAIRLQDTDGIEYEGFGGKIMRVQDVAFADDLVCFAPTPEVFQSKCDLLAAMSVVMGYEYAANKLRTFAFNTTTTGFTLRNDKWVGIPVEFNTENFIKYLGTMQSLDRGSNEEAENLQVQIADGLVRYQRRVVTTTHARRYQLAAVAPGWSFRSQYAAISNAKMDKLGLPLKKYLKGRLHLPLSFPDAILHADWSMGGLGCPQFVTLTNQRKLDLMDKCNRIEGSAKDAMEGLLYRATSETTTEKEYLEWNVREGLWISSLASQLDELGIKFHNPYYDVEDSFGTGLTIKHREIDDTLDISVIGDLVEIGEGEWKLLDPHRLGGTTEHWVAATYEGKMGLKPRVGQCWLEDREGMTEMWEVLGWTPVRVKVRKWESTGQGSRTRGKLGVFYKGLEVWVNWSDGSWTRRAVVTLPMIWQGTAWRTVKATLQQRLTFGEKCQIATVGGTGIWASDGSWMQANSLLDDGSVRCSAGIVHMMEGEVLRKVHIPLRADRRRAFVAEGWGMATALTLTTTEVVNSDCKAVVEGVMGGKTTQLLRVVSNLCGRRAKWVRSHPERRGLRTGWTTEDRAIYEADQVAMGPGNAEVMSQEACTKRILAHMSTPQLIKEGIWFEGQLAYEQQMRDVSSYLEHRGCTVENFRWMQGLMKRTPGQRGAYIKLQLALYDRDRKSREGCLDLCRCGCGNTLEDWRTVCKDPQISGLRAAMVPLKGELAGITEEIMQTTLGWRGVISMALRERLTGVTIGWTREKILRIRKEFRGWMCELIACSLQMYSVAGHKGEGVTCREKMMTRREVKVIGKKQKKSRSRRDGKRQRTLEAYFKRKEPMVQDHDVGRGKKVKTGIG